MPGAFLGWGDGATLRYDNHASRRTAVHADAASDCWRPARYASPASSERWWGRHVVASCRPSCAAAASLTGSKLVDGESAARPAVARSGRRLPGRTVEDSGEQPNPAAVSPEASHLGSATTAT